jgi:glutathione S-transferase
MWMTGQKLVPVLVVDGRAIADSTRIVEAVEALRPDPPLYPADPAERRRAVELEEWFDEELGPHIRRAAFHAILTDGDYATRFLTTGASPTARTLYRVIFPAMRAAMRWDMGIDAERSERSREKTLAALDRLEAELQPSGYLVGDRFSVADLTAAALLSPLVLPPEFPYAIPQPYPEATRRFRDGVASRPAFRWVAETYRRHRGRSSEIAA